MGPRSFGSFKALVDSRRGFLSVSNGIYDFAAAVHAVSAGKIARIAGTHGLGINHDASVLQFEIRNLRIEFKLAFLAKRLDYHSDIQIEFASRRWDIGNASSGVFWAGRSAQTLESGNVSVAIVNHSNRCGLPYKGHAIVLGQRIFVVKSRHLLRTAPVNHVNLFRAQPARRGDDVDCRVAAADDRDPPGDPHFIKALALGVFDERECVHASAEIFSWNAEIVGVAQADAKEDCVEVALQFRNGHVLANVHSGFDLHPKRAYHLDFLERLMHT